MTCDTCSRCRSLPGSTACRCGTTAGRGARRRTARRVLAATVGALSGALLLGACATGPNPSVAPTPVGAPSATATPAVPAAGEPSMTDVPAAPVAPTDLARTDADGAIAASVHLLAMLDHAYATGDTQPLLGLSGPGCGWCRSMAQQISRSALGARGTTLLVHTPGAVTASELGEGATWSSSPRTRAT
ncbi:DUF6318 family protein [Cellulomonas soli]